MSNVFAKHYRPQNATPKIGKVLPLPELPVLTKPPLPNRVSSDDCVPKVWEEGNPALQTVIICGNDHAGGQ